jgi:hypothetical protein
MLIRHSRKEAVMCIIRYGGTVRLLLGVLAAGLLWLGAAAPLAAQTAKEGTRVRVTAPAHMEQPCIGKVVSAADPLVVREKDGTMHYIPTRQVELLEVARRRDLSPEAFVGTMLGMAAGGVIGWAVYTDEECVEDASPVGCVGNIFGRLIYGMVGGVAGGLVGGLVGIRLTPERWQPVWQREVRATVGLTRSGPGLRVDLPTR